VLDSPDNWPTPQQILVILAHPDDPEFFCGGTLTRWARAGHTIDYYLFTCGDKGSNDRKVDPTELCATRRREQLEAAHVIGARDVHFMGLPDGYIEPTVELRKEIARILRAHHPDILVTCDPNNLFPSNTYGINHPDHRYAGQIVLDAAFPAAGNPLYFPELLTEEGLEPHTPREIWVAIPTAANTTVTIDVTDCWENKIAAIRRHASQINDPVQLEERLRSRHSTESTTENPRYEERFHVIRFS
jgi:LmbE family N-acetylglucosaminyl deacetylase